MSGPTVCEQMTSKTAIIIGAGPAGLTAAFELLKRTDIKPIVFEASDAHRRHRPDHQLQGQPDRHRRPPVLLEVRPGHGVVAGHPAPAGRRRRRRPDHRRHLPKQTRGITLPVNGPHPDATDEVMLVRHRLSRIYFLRKFFNYPITLSPDTVDKPRSCPHGHDRRQLRRRSAPAPSSPKDPSKTSSSTASAASSTSPSSRTTPRRSGACPATRSSAEWGAQRVKGLSITKALAHAVKQLVPEDDRRSPRRTSRPA